MPRLKPFQIGVVASMVAALALAFMPETVLQNARESFYDTLTQVAPIALSDRIVVVDIDSRAAATAEGGAWTRHETARLVDRIATAKPAVMAFDLVFSTKCDPTNPDNLALAAALAKAPSVIGFLVSGAD